MTIRHLQSGHKLSRAQGSTVIKLLEFYIPLHPIPHSIYQQSMTLTFLAEQGFLG